MEIYLSECIQVAGQTNHQKPGRWTRSYEEQTDHLLRLKPLHFIGIDHPSHA